MKLLKLELNLQESIIWAISDDIHSVCAFSSKHRNSICIHHDHYDLEKQIIEKMELKSPKIIYGDAFTIDTWDKVTSNSNKNKKAIKKIRTIKQVIKNATE